MGGGGLGGFSGAAGFSGAGVSRQRVEMGGWVYQDLSTCPGGEAEIVGTSKMRLMWEDLGGGYSVFVYFGGTPEKRSHPCVAMLKDRRGISQLHCAWFCWLRTPQSRCHLTKHAACLGHGLVLMGAQADASAVESDANSL